MKIQFWLLLAALCAGGASCTGNRKFQHIQREIKSISGQQKREAAAIKNVSLANDTKFREKKIDSLVYQRIDFAIDSLSNEVALRGLAIGLLDSITASKRGYKRADKKKLIYQLDSLVALQNDSARRLLACQMVEEGLKNTNYSLFKLAAFFGPGKYSIPDGKEWVVDSAFSTLIDSVISFSSKYSQLPKRATLVILGYADGTGFDPHSSLYIELMRHANKKNLSRQDLNKVLSDLRAQSLLRQLQKQMNSKLAGNRGTGVLEVDFVGSGRGEAFPFPFINDYKDDDERRRIVLCYWTVLPI